jgi:hypothetical protein
MAAMVMRIGAATLRRALGGVKAVAPRTGRPYWPKPRLGSNAASHRWDGASCRSMSQEAYRSRMTVRTGCTSGRGRSRTGIAAVKGRGH